MAVNQTSAPAVEPLSTAEAKDHLKITHSDDDTIIDSYVTAARLWCEAFIQRQLITATWELVLDAFWADAIPLPFPPLASVTSVQYIDTDGDSQTFSSDDYVVDTKSAPGRIYLAYNESWPTTRQVREAVTITYVAGYGASGSDVPEEIRTAIRLLTAHYYEHREGEAGAVPDVVRQILWSKRCVGVPISDGFIGPFG
jgi:uncharacterized phiE125 gp8 family phage protein